MNVKCIDGSTLSDLILQSDGVELLDSYAEKTQPGQADLLDRIDTTREAPHAEPRDQDDQVTATDAGDDLSVEITGLKKVETAFGSNGLNRSAGTITGMFSSGIQLDGWLATFKLFGRSFDVNPMIEHRTKVSFFDKDENEYHPAELGEAELPNGWLSHGGRPRNIEVPSGQSRNYLAGVGMPSSAYISRITIDRYDIEITLDYELRQKLLGVPDEIQKLI